LPVRSTAAVMCEMPSWNDIRVTSTGPHRVDCDIRFFYDEGETLRLSPRME